MNRITTLLVLGAFLPVFSFAQIFKAGQSGNQTLPSGHGKSSFIGPNLVQAPAESASSSPTFPICAFDEMNHKHAQEDPDFEQEMKHYLEEVVPTLSEVGGAEKSTVPPLMTVSVVVHVIHNGEPVGQGQNLSAAQILAQLEILNEDFASLNPQFFNTPGPWFNLAGTPNIDFCLATVDPVGNPTVGITRHNLQVTGSSWNNNNINSFIKPQTKWDPLRYFNIYVLPIPGTTSAGGVVGFSNYPTPGLIGSNQDGVVIDYRWFGAPGFGVSGWRALTHETGHYLGLPHTFNGNSCNNDDGIADTPNMDKSTREYVTLNCNEGYPAGPVSCGNEHLYVNYMDYVTENCYTSFTNGQVNVMRAVLNGTSQGFGYGSRNGLIQNAPAQCTIPANDAGITRIISPEEVTCTPNQLTPLVTLRNFGTEDLTSATITLQAGTALPVNYSWTGNLFPGQSTDVTLPAFSPPLGQYTLSIYTQQPNGMTDERLANDTTAALLFTHVALALPVSEDFEGETGFPTSTGVFEFNITSDDFAWELTDNASGFGVGATSAVFNNFEGTINNNPYGTIDALITRHFDFSNVTGAQLKFDVAYAPYDNFLTDSLLVLVATNCSQNFNQQVYRKGGVQLSTAPATTQPFVPLASQWRTETIDLSAYDGFSDVTLALINLSGWGNSLYIDNIRVGMDCSAITSSFDIVPNGCDNAPGACNGSATVNLTNHNGSLSYQWEGWPASHNLPTIYQLCPQQVSVTVTDGFGCQVVATANVPQAPAPTLNVSSTQVTTFGGSNGTATVTVTGGVAPYNYNWSNGVMQTAVTQNTSTITGLTAGTYTVTVTNANGCESTSTVTVTSICAGFSVNTSIGNVSCNGGSNGSVFATPQNGSGPYTYLWSNGATTAGINNLTAGNYTVTVTSGAGCPATKTATVGQPSAIVLTMSSTGETVFNAQDGTASVAVSGGSPGYTYLWSNGGITPMITGLAPGEYSVTVMDVVGCTMSGMVTVNQVSCAGFSSSLSSTNVSCNGLQDGTASVSVTGSTPPVTYSWSNSAATSSVSNLAPGAISVTVSDLAGCSSQHSTTITEWPVLSISASSTHETAVDANDGTASAAANGGTGSNYQYEWSNGASTANISNLAPGIYTVTATDGNGCEATASVEVEAYFCGVSLILSSQPASCPTVADGMAAVETVTGGSGPFAYNWSNGSTSFMIQNVVAGVYGVTVTDASGCAAQGQVTVVSADVTPPVVSTQNITVSLEANGSVTINGDMVDDGSFDNCSMVSVVVSPQTFTCANLGQNTVTVQVTDSSNNQSTGTAIVTVVDQTPPVVTCPPNISVTTCGPVSYSLPTAMDLCSNVTLVLTSGFNSGQVFPTGTTPVTWTATDAFGNSATCTFTVTVQSEISLVSIVNEPSCHGDADGFIDLVISGGTVPYTTMWSHGGGPSNLPAGNYTVTVLDANGCTLTEDYEITEPDELVFELLGTTPASGSMADGTISFSVNGGTGPFSIAWYNGSGTLLPGFNPLAVAAGSYQATVIDANTCEAQSAVIVVDQLNQAADVALANAIRLFPNPSGGKVMLQLDLPKAERVGAQVFDITGRQLFSIPEELVSSKTMQLDFQTFGPGVYWVKVFAGEAVAMRRVVIL